MHGHYDREGCAASAVGDMVKSVLADQKFTIEQLEHYIHGHR